MLLLLLSVNAGPEHRLATVVFLDIELLNFGVSSLVIKSHSQLVVSLVNRIPPRLVKLERPNRHGLLIAYPSLVQGTG